MNKRMPLVLLAWLAAGLLGLAQAPSGYIIFKDGFSIHGRVVQQKKFEVDPASGVGISIVAPGGFTFLDDDVRRIYFPPGQIQEIVPLKPGELTKDQLVLFRQRVSPRVNVMLPAWRFESLPAFNAKWEREVRVATSKSSFPMHQRIVLLTPQKMQIMSMTHNWEMNFLTKEMPFAEVTKLVTDYYNDKKDFKELTEADKKFLLALFHHQAGWMDEAEREAEALLELAPEHRKKIEELQDKIRKDKAKRFADEFEPLSQAKQHRPLLERLQTYERDGLAEKVPQKIQLLAQDLKNKYQADDEKLVQVKGLIKFLMSQSPQPRGFWLNGTDTISKELNYDTLPRLETFATFAEQYKREFDQGKKPNLKVEDVLALAITGWHLGTISAEPDVKLAEKLWKCRQFLPEYMKADTIGERSRLAESWGKETKLPIDVVARVIQHLPPPNAYEKITNEIESLDLDLPDSPTGSYKVLLPPDYHHQRAHPVLLLLHGRETADLLIERWKTLAAKYGFILAAPLWTKASKGGYAYTDREQNFHMNCLRDLKRRFQVDTDRVFLYGWDQGAEVAWDVSLSHPDQFAGVLPMCGTPGIYPKQYWPNAKHVPFYIVDGEKDGAGPAVIRGVFKDWIRSNYPAYFLEYKGRANELFTGEFEPMMEWMSRKKRFYPVRTLGNGIGDEFKTHRNSDNRFYWLSTDEIADAHLQDYASWVNYRPAALLQAAITIGNESDTKGNAKITNQISIRAIGLKQLTVWLSPAMIDFTKPVMLRVNGKTVGTTRVVQPNITTMFEEYFQNVDRQRLYYAKMDMRF